MNQTPFVFDSRQEDEPWTDLTTLAQDSDDEKDGKTLRIPSKKVKSGTSTPVIAGMK